MKIIYYHENGNVIGAYDGRTLESEKNEKINILREYTTHLIRSKVDVHEEINCANGLYDSEPEKKAFILDWLKECRDFYLNKKSLILAANTLDNLDEIIIYKDIG